MTDAVFVYITAKDKAEALAIGQALVEARLAACVNVWEPMTSLYWWEGKIQRDQEAVLIAKTLASHLDALIAEVKARHSYSCPCIVSWPIVAGNAAYLEWIDQNVGKGGSPPG